MRLLFSFPKSLLLAILWACVFFLLAESDSNAQNRSIQKLETLVKTDTTLANTFFSKAEKLAKASQYDSSNFYFQKASSLYEKSAKRSGESAIWKKFVRCFNTMSNNFREKADFENAMKRANRALKVGLDKLGGEHPVVASSYANIGAIHEDEGQYDAALEIYKKALAIFIHALGEKHLEVARCYNNMGTAYYEKGDFYKALEFYEKSMAIKVQNFGINHISLAASNNNIGIIYARRGDYDRALAYFNKSLEIEIEKYGEQNGRIAADYTNIGNVYYFKRDYFHALKSYEKAVEIKIHNFGGIHPDVAATYNNMGSVHQNKGDFEHAAEFFEKSLAIKIQTLGQNHASVAATYNNLGNVYLSMSNFNRALDSYEKSLQIKINSFGEDHPSLASNYENIGKIYCERKTYNKALDYHKKAMDIRIHSLGEKHHFVAGSYHHIGTVFLEKGDYEKALEYYDKAMALSKRTFGEKHPEVAVNYYKIGEVFDRKGDDEKALYYFQKSILSYVSDFTDSSIYRNPRLKNINSEIDLLRVLESKAKVCWQLFLKKTQGLKELQMSFSTYQLATELMDKIRSGYRTEGSKLFLGEDGVEIYSPAIQAALSLYKKTKDKSYKTQAFFLAEKSKSAVLQATISESKAKAFAGIPERLLETERKLRIDLAHYDTQIQREKRKKDNQDSLKIADFENRYFALKRQYDKLISKFEKTYPNYYELKYHTQSASIHEIQQALDNKTALVEYSVGDSALHIFAITQDKFEIVTVPIDSSFNQSIVQFYSAIKKLKKTQFIESSALLYSSLVQPIEKQIASKEKLVIIPDGRLFYLPYEALAPREALLASKTGSSGRVDFSALRYLVRNYEISYHYSATLYLKHSRRATANPSTTPGEFIGFAPVFSDAVAGGKILRSHRSVFDSTYNDDLRAVDVDGKNLTELKFTEQEVASIVKLFADKKNPSRGYFHQQASEQNFKSQAGKFKFVHIATHSLMNAMQPKLSAIVLSQPTDTSFTEDGVLYAAETYNLNLNADLVVLSSCESGIGKFVKGEGLMSLTRGFLYAGTRNILFSLWKVYDDSTRDLMVSFYRHVVAGKNYSAALRLAKLAMLENEKTAFPRTWSAFVLVGR